MWRNKAINEKSLPMEGQIIRSIQKLFLEHWRPKVPVSTSVPARNSARWCCPSQGMLKLNCDAAVGDLSSCIAVVARDWREISGGCWCLRFQRKLTPISLFK